jgi:hypothetical protein
MSRSELMELEHMIRIDKNDEYVDPNEFDRLLESEPVAED